MPSGSLSEILINVENEIICLPRSSEIRYSENKKSGVGLSLVVQRLAIKKTRDKSTVTLYI